MVEEYIVFKVLKKWAMPVKQGTYKTEEEAMSRTKKPKKDKDKPRGIVRVQKKKR